VNTLKDVFENVASRKSSLMLKTSAFTIVYNVVFTLA